MLPDDSNENILSRMRWYSTIILLTDISGSLQVLQATWLALLQWGQTQEQPGSGSQSKAAKVRKQESADNTWHIFYHISNLH